MPVIRCGQPGDLAEVAAIQAASPEAAQWPVAEYMQHDFHVSVHADRVVGFLVSRTVAQGECELLNLVVATEFRRQGVGHALISPLLAAPGTVVYLEVRESNEIALQFYKSLGFLEVNRRTQYYDSPLEAAIVMKFHSC
ncbi:MAG TPA: GNAT family N-acetyltransferase [Bryobacteraceae bacterium]|nr:GNAT family N-acetyltransferase [Bryobacteraceae bacterium]